MIPNILREKVLQGKFSRYHSRDNIDDVHRIDLTADELVNALMGLADSRHVCILDSCGIGHQGSHLLIAGVDPVKSFEISDDEPDLILDRLSDALTSDFAAIFTLSYDLGLKLNNITSRHRSNEPGAFVSLFRKLVIHDYDTNSTFLTGGETDSQELIDSLVSARFTPKKSTDLPQIRTNYVHDDYLRSVEVIKEFIRRGDTYQTNLTRQITTQFQNEFDPRSFFLRMRSKHPSPFSAFLKRNDSTVVSASPERFFRIANGRISVSPIKGTRPRGTTFPIDQELRNELRLSEKDRAENVMIVDLLRNDLGRVCEFGSVSLERLCEIEEHPSLFHLVSTVSGRLRQDVNITDVLRSLFPCGSITGAPKISTMKIIDEIEPTARGLSMGTIGYRLPHSFGLGETIDTSVAIRTMVIQGNTAAFNVGGGIVIDSNPESEYSETVTKSKALLDSLE